MNEKKTYHPFLPKTSGEHLKKPDERGEYVENPELLNQLAKDLVVAKGSPPDVLSAIPTVWARPLLFGHAIIDHNHTAHESVEQEWRGLLGIFCFMKFFNMNVVPKPFDLSPEKKGKFEGVLYSLIPDRTDPLWRTIHLIYVDNILVGGTSPLSLVFTAADYRLPSSFPWQKNGLLIDPVHHFREIGPEGRKYLSFLRGWIEKVAEDVKDEKNEKGVAEVLRDGDIRGQLVDQLEEWAENIWEISEKRPTEENPLISSLPYNLISDPLKVPEGEKFILEGDFFIKSSKKPNVIVAWREGWKQKGKRVYGAFTAGKVKFPGDEFPGEAQGKELSKGKIKCDWIIPELLFFTDKMLRLSLDSRNVSLCHEQGYVPPLKKEILEYFSPDELIKAFEWRTKEGNIEAVLKIPLRDGGRAVVSHEYGKKDIIEETYEAPAPFLALWPDFEAKDWKHHFCISQKPTATPELRFEPYVSKIEKKAEKPEQAPEFVLWKSAESPEAISCLWQEKSAGLILIRKLDKVPSLSESWKVSVDFGTSNTSVFYQGSEDEKPLPLIFENRCVTFTKRADEAPQTRFLTTSFLPPTKASGIFSTNFGAFLGLREGEPIFDGVIFFADITQFAPWLESLEKRQGFFVPNLKWTTDQTKRQYISTFLRQLFLMIAAEARSRGVKEINLCWSYPSAFTPRMFKDLDSAWKTLREIYAKDFDFLKPQLKEPQTESVAVCSYLVKDRIAAPSAHTTALVVIDLGGGTSDIAIWLKGKIQAQSSILLAGNVLAEYIRENDDVCNILSHMAKINLTHLFRIETLTASTLNMMLKYKGEDILHELHLHEKGDPHTTRARTIIFLIFAGVLYYVGLLLKKIAQTNEIISCDIYFAGNGANFLNWIQRSPKHYINSLKKFLVAPNSPALNEGNVSFYDTPPIHPKEEVARGLLQEVIQAEPTPVLLVGESGYKFEDQDLSWSEDLEGRKKEMIDPNKLRVPLRFKELSNLVDIFDKEAENLMLERIKPFANEAFIKSRIEQEISTFRNDPERALIQPFFVEEVKQLLRQLCRTKVEVGIKK
jgi:hypothetical protein